MFAVQEKKKKKNKRNSCGFSNFVSMGSKLCSSGLEDFEFKIYANTNHLIFKN